MFLFTIFLCGLLFFAGGADILLIEDLAMVIAIGFDVDPENPDLMVVTMTSPTLSEEKKNHGNRHRQRNLSIRPCTMFSGKAKIFWSLARQMSSFFARNLPAAAD